MHLLELSLVQQKQKQKQKQTRTCVRTMLLCRRCGAIETPPARTQSVAVGCSAPPLTAATPTQSVSHLVSGLMDGWVGG